VTHYLTCSHCGEVLIHFVTRNHRVYCRACANTLELPAPKKCTVCRKQDAQFEPRQQPLLTAHRTYLCMDCYMDACVDDDEWEMIE